LTKQGYQEELGAAYISLNHNFRTSLWLKQMAAGGLAWPLANAWCPLRGHLLDDPRAPEALLRRSLTGDCLLAPRGAYDFRKSIL
jgi:hypothetical protein